jgi:flavin reductase (DIM6/NTAB) family NADH-FMN oxidoreductase RutF/DNA-binding MarR family transcriptional regulator
MSKIATDALPMRALLADYPTGVTIVTTTNPQGKQVGLTANSFSSLSLNPPLVTWALGLSSANLDNFTRAPHYVINLLGADQLETARRFASKDNDRFAGITPELSPNGQPVLPGSLAWLECAPQPGQPHLDAGDHRLFIGRVVHAQKGHGDEALSFHRGQLLRFTGNSNPRAHTSSLSFVDDYLAYLLARASEHVSAEFHQVVRQHNLPVVQWRVLASLSDAPGLSIGLLATTVLVKQPTLTKLIDRMQIDGLVSRKIDPQDKRRTLVHITALGKRKVSSLLQKAKAHEATLVNDMGKVQVSDMKQQLRAMIARYNQPLK